VFFNNDARTPLLQVKHIELKANINSILTMYGIYIYDLIFIEGVKLQQTPSKVPRKLLTVEKQ